MRRISLSIVIFFIPLIVSCGTVPQTSTSSNPGITRGPETLIVPPVQNTVPGMVTATATIRASQPTWTPTVTLRPPEPTHTATEPLPTPTRTATLTPTLSPTPSAGLPCPSGLTQVGVQVINFIGGTDHIRLVINGTEFDIPPRDAISPYATCILLYVGRHRWSASLRGYRSILAQELEVVAGKDLEPLRFCISEGEFTHKCVGPSPTVPAESVPLEPVPTATPSAPG